MLVDCRHIAFPFPFSLLVSCRSILSGIHGWVITHRSEVMIRKALHLQVKIPLFRNLRQRRISFSFFRCVFHYLIFRHSVIAVPIYKMVLFEHRHQCFLCLGIGLSTPVQTQDREQIRGRIPFRLYLSAFSRTEIEKQVFFYRVLSGRKLSLRLFKKVTSSFSYQYR